MKKNIRIAVPNPCHEKWSSFTKTSGGGFCSSCQKEVIDFTSWSDERIKSYFKNLPGHTCGRFRSQQLKAYSDNDGSRTELNWISVALAGTLTLFSSREVTAQQTTKQTTERHLSENADKPAPIQKDGGLGQKVARGVVMSVEERGPIPGVNVILQGTAIGTSTDVDGKFTLTLPGSDSVGVLIFSFIGFKSVEWPVRDALSQDMLVRMTYDDVSLSGEIIVGGAVSCKWYSPRRLWWKLRNLVGL